ncbi:hypothetical protein JW964_11050 [candidate division KSB1 bacterium]|nr:hypothetical protein [candidate division KSB1 bacterium]
MIRSQKYRKATISIINKKAFWNVYDHLGTLILLNLLSVVLILTFIGIPYALSGLFGITKQIAYYEHVEFRDYWSNMKKYFKKAFLLVIFTIIFLFLLAANLYFYYIQIISSHTDANMRIIFSLMLGIMVWLSILFLIFLHYLLPMMVQSDDKFVSLLKRSYFLLLDNIAISLYLFLSSIFWFIIGVYTGIIAFFLSFSVISVVCQTAIREVLNQYQPEDFSKEEEVRGFGDLIRPWR